MITKEQNNEITSFLLSKNLPIDLVLEVKDHMIEQIENINKENFEEAFEQVKFSWKEELKMVFSFKSPFKKITFYHKNILNRTENEFLKKSFYYFMLFFVVSIMLCMYSKSLARTFHMMVYLIISLISVVSMIFYYKYWNSASLQEKRKISIYQRGALLYFVSGLYIIILNLMNFDLRFEKMYKAINSLFYYKNFDSIYINIINNYLFVYVWILGLFYFLNYKKTVSYLKNRINFNL